MPVENFEKDAMSNQTTETGAEVRGATHFIKEWRKHRELTMDQLGALITLSGSMISQLERGKAFYTQNTLEKIAKALKVEPWQLLACGPNENKELWRTVMNWKGDSDVFSQISESSTHAFEVMVNENCKAGVEAAAASVRRFYKSGPEEEASLF